MGIKKPRNPVVIDECNVETIKHWTAYYVQSHA